MIYLMKKDINLGYLFFISFVAALGGFLFGYDTAVISGTISQVSSQFALDAINQGWYVGCALLGSIGGVAVAGMLGDWLGRKKAMIVSAVLFSASAIGCALKSTFGELEFAVWGIVVSGWPLLSARCISPSLQPPNTADVWCRSISSP